MNLTSRVGKLERAGGNAACPKCHDRGVGGVAMWVNGVELSRSGGCQRCGRFGGFLKRILLNYDSEERAEEARRALR